jgi:hypothetical protein
MIELYVSTEIALISSQDLTALLSTNSVECQITENYSSYNCKFSAKPVVEKGFYIKIFNLPSLLFKKKVWDILKKVLSISCAFVECEEYKGCVLNWPNIFRDSMCSYS